MTVLEVYAALTTIVDILIVMFLNKCTNISCEVHLKYSIDLVATLIELECYVLAVGIPSRCRHIVLMGEELRRRLHHTSRSHLNDDRHTIVQRVARLGVFLFVEEGELRPTNLRPVPYPS
jgi:hypothetical protein